MSGTQIGRTVGGASHRRRHVIVGAVAILMTLMSPAGASAVGGSDPTADDAARQKSVYLFTDADRTVFCNVIARDAYTGESSVRCDTAGLPAWQAPPRAADCPSFAGWGTSVRLDTYSLPRFACVNDSLGNDNRLPAGTVVTQGDFTCTVLAPGVRCRDNLLGHGFEVSLASYTTLRPAAKNRLAPSGLGKLKLGMTVKNARSTGYLKRGVGLCGTPELKARWRGALRWKRGRLVEVYSGIGGGISTRQGVGSGSTLADLQARHPGLAGPVATKSLADGSSLWVYTQRTRRGVLVFVVDAAASSRTPAALDLVTDVFAARKWTPRRGLAPSC